MEEVLTLAQGVEEVLIVVDLDSRDCAELLDIFLVLLRLLHNHSLVRTPCREHLHAERIVLDMLVIFESVCRVVSGADYLHVESLHQLLTSELLCLELCSTFVVDGTCCLRAQKFVHPEYSCELEMCPVVERVSHGIRHGLGPFLEFLIAAACACDELFRHTVASHSPPLVVVSTEPYLCEVLELVVVCNHLRHEVAVVVDDRHVLCALVV